jgi:hypothetical protein
MKMKYFLKNLYSRIIIFISMKHSNTINIHWRVFTTYMVQINNISTL